MERMYPNRPGKYGRIVDVLQREAAYRFTGVRLGGGVVTGVLEADQRALGHLLLTPELPEPERDGIRVDVVLLLGEGGGDEGEDAEGQ